MGHFHGNTFLQLLDHVPHIFDVITQLVARFLILGEQVYRLAFISQLLGPVIAGDDRVVAAQATGDRKSVV